MSNEKRQVTNVKWRKLTLFALGVAGVAFLLGRGKDPAPALGCGRQPPAAYWTWSAAESTKVEAIVTAWKDSLRSWFEETDANLTDSPPVIPETTRKVLHKSMKDRKFRPASAVGSFFFPKSFHRVFEGDSAYGMVDSFIVTKDTTVTVRLNEYFQGHVYITTDSAVQFISDTLLNGMPFKLYDTVFSPVTMQETLAFNGWSERYLEIEPVDKTKRDDWYLKRVTGGGRIGFPDDVNAPYLGSAQVLTATGRRDTLVLRPDSSHLGIQKLVTRDSVLTYTTGDSIIVWMSNTALLAHLWWSPEEIVLFAHLPDPANPHKTIRKQIRPVAGFNAPYALGFKLPAGLNQVYVEVIPISSLTEPGSVFSTRLWAILMDVK